MAKVQSLLGLLEMVDGTMTRVLQMATLPVSTPYQWGQLIRPVDKLTMMRTVLGKWWSLTLSTPKPFQERVTTILTTK